MVENQIRELEEQLLQPEVRSSAQALNELLALDFIEIGSTGKVWTKEEIIDALTDEPPRAMALDSFRITIVTPTVVLATYRLLQSEPGRELSPHSFRSSLWKLLHGKWQMIFHQGTIIDTR